MVKVLPAKFLHCQITIFSLVTNKYLSNTFGNILFYLKLHLRILASIDGSCLQQLLLYCSNNDYLFPLFFLLLQLELSCKEKLFLLPPFNYLFSMYLYKYKLVNIYFILWQITYIFFLFYFSFSHCSSFSDWFLFPFNMPSFYF